MLTSLQFPMQSKKPVTIIEANKQNRLQSPLRPTPSTAYHNIVFPNIPRIRPISLKHKELDNKTAQWYPMFDGVQQKQYKSEDII